MKRLVFVSTVLYMVIPSKELLIESLDDVLVYPIEPPLNIQKRSTSGSKQNDAFKKFIEEKLIQQTQALEHIYKMVTTNEELTKQLLDNLSTKVQRPELPEKVEVVTVKQTRRELAEQSSNPFVKMGQNIPKYGRLFKDLVLKEINNDPDPSPLVDLDPSAAEFLTRRSFSDSPRVVPALQNNQQVSPWCTIALLCRRTMHPICGFDDNFGYGKFDDLCHMLQVNCYWKYNFALVPTCKSTL